MFHPSESIHIINKKKKSKKGSNHDSSERPKKILSRQRASTWSSPSFKETAAAASAAVDVAYHTNTTTTATGGQPQPPSSNININHNTNKTANSFRGMFGIRKHHQSSPNATTVVQSSGELVAQPLTINASYRSSSTPGDMSIPNNNGDLSCNSSIISGALPKEKLDDWLNSSNDHNIHISNSDSYSPNYHSATPQSITTTRCEGTTTTAEEAPATTTKNTIPPPPPLYNNTTNGGGNSFSKIYPPNFKNVTYKQEEETKEEYSAISRSYSNEERILFQNTSSTMDNEELELDSTKTSQQQQQQQQQQTARKLTGTSEDYNSNSNDDSTTCSFLQNDTSNEDDDDYFNTNSTHLSVHHRHNHQYRRRRFLICPEIPKPSWSRISSAIVRHAPCFSFCGTEETSFTDRVILTKLNKLCAIFALYHILCGVFFLVVLMSPAVADRSLTGDSNSNEVSITDTTWSTNNKQDSFYSEALTPNLWIPSGGLLWIAVLGLVVFITMISTVPAIRRVNLQGALRYMWVLYWILPLQVFFCVWLIDINSVTDVWIQHWWSGRSMAWFREVLCKDGTAHCACARPLIMENDTAIMSLWCQANCNINDSSVNTTTNEDAINYWLNNTSDCDLEIREKAVTRMSGISYFFFVASAIGGLVLVALLVLALFLLQRIISEPIVKSSKEANIPLWLTFPIICCFLGGYFFLFSIDSILGSSSHIQTVHWIGICYMVSAGAFTVSALLGWFIAAKTVLNPRDKTRKQIAIYLFIGTMVLTIFAVCKFIVSLF